MNDVYTLCKRGPFSSLLTNGRWLFQIIPIYRKALFYFSTSTRIQGVWLYPFWATYKDLVICASSISIKLSNHCKPRDTVYRETFHHLFFKVRPFRPRCHAMGELKTGRNHKNVWITVLIRKNVCIVHVYLTVPEFVKRRNHFLREF